MARIILGVLSVLAAVGGAVAQFGPFHARFASRRFFSFWPASLLLLLVLGLLPLRVRRPVVFLLVFVVLAGFGGGLYYFQYVIKPTMVKGFIAAAFAPKPSTVSAEPAKMEKWMPQLPAIGTLRAFQGIDIAPQVAGVVTAIHFQSSPGRRCRRAASSDRRFRRTGRFEERHGAIRPKTPKPHLEYSRSILVSKI